MSLFEFKKSSSKTQSKRPPSSKQRLSSSSALVVVNIVVLILLIGFMVFWFFIKPPYFILTGDCPYPLEKQGMFACQPCEPGLHYNTQTKTCQAQYGPESCNSSFNTSKTPWMIDNIDFTYLKGQRNGKICKPVYELNGLYQASPDSYQFVKSCGEGMTHIKSHISAYGAKKTVSICTGYQYCGQPHSEFQALNARYGSECAADCDSFGANWVYLINEHNEKMCQAVCPDGYTRDKDKMSECTKNTSIATYYIIDGVKYGSIKQSCDDKHAFSYIKNNDKYCTSACSESIGFPFLDEKSKTCLSECKLHVREENGHKFCETSSKIITAPVLHKQNPAESVNSMINALIRPEKKALERYQQTLKTDNLNPDQAHLLIKQTIRQWPEEDTSYTAAADYWIRNNDPKQALRLLTWRPYPIADHIEYYGTLAYTFLINLNDKHAQQIYDSLVRLEPKNPKWWLGLGTSFDHLGKKPQAAKAWRKAYQYADKNAEYVSFLESKLQSEDAEA